MQRLKRIFRCLYCTAVFADKRARRMHRLKHHDWPMERKKAA